MSDSEKRYDLAVIGGGSAGYAAARTALDHGMKPVVIEGGAKVGGLCILRGCMPTKALLYAAEVMHLSREAATWGIRNPSPDYDFGDVMRRKNEMIEDFASYRREQLESGRFDFIRANARFMTPNELELDNGKRIHAAHILISTGSSVSRPPIPSLEQIGYLTSDSALELTSLPQSIIVLGGGAIAVEFAQFFARFGVRTTVMQRSPHILKDFDTDAAEAVEASFRDEGIEVITSTRLTRAEKTKTGKKIHFEHDGSAQDIEAEEIFFALGRSPNTASLRLQNAGVETEPNGRIHTNQYQQTSVPNIFAAGDCCGPHEIVHIAIQQGELAVNNMVTDGAPIPIDYRLLSSIVFTDPQCAVVGLTEKQATERGIPYLAASYPFNDHGKSMIMNARHGFVKLLAAPDTGVILGGSCVGPVGGELIHEIIVAMAANLTVQQFAAIPHYHPTLAEIWGYPAEDLAEQIGVKQ